MTRSSYQRRTVAGARHSEATDVIGGCDKLIIAADSGCGYLLGLGLGLGT